MAEKKTLSPEEKLLKVIQEGDDAGVGNPVPVAPPPGRDPASGASPRIRLASPETRESVERPVIAPSQAVYEPPAPGAVPGKKVASGGRIIGTVNQVLVGVILIMLGLTVYEVWASITAPSLARDTVLVRPPEAVTIAEPPATNGLAEPDWNIEKTLAAYRKRPIFRSQGEVNQDETVRPPTKPPDETEGAESLDLIGLSGDAASGAGVEAIIVNRSTHKMHVVGLGDRIVIGDSRELTVERIDSGEAILSDGENKITVK